MLKYFLFLQNKASALNDYILNIHTHYKEVKAYTKNEQATTVAKFKVVLAHEIGYLVGVEHVEKRKLLIKSLSLKGLTIHKE